MKTEIFESYQEWEQRKDKAVNGVSTKFAQKYPNWEEMNTTNTGCWNCAECWNCFNCVECKECINCDAIKQCVQCKECYMCMECVGCIKCHHCAQCRECSECTHCFECVKKNFLKNVGVERDIVIFDKIEIKK